MLCLSVPSSCLRDLTASASIVDVKKGKSPQRPQYQKYPLGYRHRILLEGLVCATGAPDNGPVCQQNPSQVYRSSAIPRPVGTVAHQSRGRNGRTRSPCNSASTPRPLCPPPHPTTSPAHPPPIP